jgi:tetratricopeptide (TPR) repeat protein
MKNMDVQAQALLILQAKAQVALEVAISGLSETERKVIGTPQRWSTKDLLAHISNWWRIQGERFAQVAQGNSAVDFAWSDETNATLFITSAHYSWEEVITEMRRSSVLWQAAVKNLKLEHLLLQDPHEEGNGQRLWRLVLANGYLHPLLHLTEHYLEQGKLVQATQIQKEMAAQILASLPQAANLAHYNLACFYAQTGREEQAVTELQRAFALDSTLKSLAWQDKDFAPLQTYTPFQTLFDERKGN